MINTVKNCVSITISFFFLYSSNVLTIKMISVWASFSRKALTWVNLESKTLWYYQNPCKRFRETYMYINIYVGIYKISCLIKLRMSYTYTFCPNSSFLLLIYINIFVCILVVYTFINHLSDCVQIFENRSAHNSADSRPKNSFFSFLAL